MRYSYHGLIAIQLLTTTSFAGATPKAPQSPIPTVEVSPSSTKASQKPSDTSQNRALTLGNISTEVEGDMTIITARLNKSPEWKDIIIEEHGTFLQIKLPKTMIPASGDFLDGNGPFLRKLASFQLPEDDGALRFFLNQDAAKAKLATTAELLGDRIVVTIDHKKLEQLIAPQASQKTELSSADEIISKTNVEKNSPAPADLVAAAATNPQKTVKNTEKPGVDLHNQLMKVAAFCAGLFVLFLGAQLFRLKSRNKSQTKSRHEPIEPVSMKILSNISVGNKQKLTLVQVGGQQILLGVGPESINLITTIADRSMSATFAGHLQQANPNTEIRLKAPEDVSAPKATRRSITAGATTGASRLESAIKGSRINVGVGEEGPKNLNHHTVKKEDDITKLLRDRLRNLPPG